MYYFTLKIQARLPKSRKKLQSAILVAGYRYSIPSPQRKSKFAVCYSLKNEGKNLYLKKNKIDFSSDRVFCTIGNKKI